jgi:hypothetical protein
MTEYGGWPMSDSVECVVESVKRVGGKITVNARVYFDEGVPTGCADVENHESVSGTIEVTLDIHTERAVVEETD